MPPRLANTSWFCAIELTRSAARAGTALALAVRGEGEHIAGGYLGQPAVGTLEHQLPSMVETDKAALDLRVAITHRNRLAQPARVLQPIGQNRGERAAAIPLRQTAAHCGGEPCKQLLRRYGRAVRRQISCRKAASLCRRWMAAAIDPDADHNDEALLRSGLGRRFAFNEDAGTFAAIEQKIVRPFEFQARRERTGFEHNGVPQRQRGDKCKLRRVFERRRIAE